MENRNITHGRPLLSVIVPALNEAPSAAALVQRVREVRHTVPDFDVELIVIDDGSTDGTSEALLAAADDTDRLTVVELARNFGSHYAISAGLDHCHGDVAVVLGADLQEPVDLTSRFVEQWRAGHQVVWGIRTTRTGSGTAYNAGSRLFSHLFVRYAQLSNYPAEGPSGVLIDRSVIEAVRAMGERNRNVLALIAWVGFDQTRVEYEQSPRHHGNSRWTRAKSIRLAIDSLIQFSSFPLRFSTMLGIGTALVGVVYAVALILRSVLGVDTPSGWPTLVVVVLLIGGAQLVMLGVVGEYLWRIADESRGRPLYVVRRVRRPEAAPDAAAPAAAAPASAAPASAATPSAGAVVSAERAADDNPLGIVQPGSPMEV